MEPLEKRQGTRLKEARKAAGFTKSAAAACSAFGWKPSTYRTHEAGTRTIGHDDAEKYTRAFRNLGSTVTAEQVLFPDGKPDKVAVKPEDMDGAYERGWRDAMARVAGMAQHEPPPPPPAARKKKPGPKRPKK